MKNEKLIHGVCVIGSVDTQTRCAHYKSELDIIAIKFKCCGDWFSCYECHAASVEHDAAVWSKNEFDTPAILCGVCGYQLTINEYLSSDSSCPQCRSRFNPKCALHYHLYFQIPL